MSGKDLIKKVNFNEQFSTIKKKMDTNIRKCADTITSSVKKYGKAMPEAVIDELFRRITRFFHITVDFFFLLLRKVVYKFLEFGAFLVGRDDLVKRFFNASASVYDSILYSIPHLQKGISLILDRMKLVKRGKVLELFCGTGRLTHQLAVLSDEIIGVDVSSKMILRAARIANTLGLKNVNYKLIKSYSLPFDSNLFDTVVSSVGFSYLGPADRERRYQFSTIKLHGQRG
ncbi:MAG: methyltransferase domain-containing protein [Thermoplasmata archaeon]